MGLFFIDTQTGQVATQRQLITAGVATADDLPAPPWHRVRGSGDTSTLWHAVLRKRTHGVFIGSMVFRHSDHHASLLRDGWEEVDVEAIRASAHSDTSEGSEVAPSPWTF